jgi:hypothetical protein
MSIERQYGRIIFVCDDCGNTFEASSRDFEGAWHEAKEEGWTVTQKGKDWVHWCHQPCEPSA